jgi:uncharacterized membrane protein
VSAALVRFADRHEVLAGFGLVVVACFAWYGAFWFGFDLFEVLAGIAIVGLLVTGRRRERELEWTRGQLRRALEALERLERDE